MLAFEWLADGAQGTLADMLAHVADHLGNTPAVARKSYVHPALIELAKSGKREKACGKLPPATRWLTRYERGLLAFLDGRP
jgi:DNA topoisomerase-1